MEVLTSSEMNSTLNGVSPAMARLLLCSWEHLLIDAIWGLYPLLAAKDNRPPGSEDVSPTSFNQRADSEGVSLTSCYGRSKFRRRVTHFV